MIETVGLTKRYRDRVALADLNLKIDQGDVFGFIGPNGAGKSTTIKILATLLRPTSGMARVAGFSVDAGVREIRRAMGYMPDFFGLYDDLTVREYLEFFAAAYKIRGKARKKVIDDVLALVDLGHRADAQIDALSRGMQQRLSLARVLLHDPKVLLLDEPASGLDPRARVEFREIIKELRRMGKTVLISSHILPELADMCNKVGIIEKGRLVASGSVDEVIQRAQGERWVVFEVMGPRPPSGAYPVATAGGAPSVTPPQDMPQSTAIERARVIASGVAGVLAVEDVPDFPGQRLRARLDTNADPSAIPSAIIASGLRLTFYQEEQIDLEDAFMRLTQGIVS
jgi:ABC-2 type transport system ATP-binding protein